MTHTSAETPRDRVLAAAAEIFARSGYAGARIDEIAALAGVNKAMVYYHVGDKSHIYAVVVGDRVDRVAAALRAAITPDATAEENLRAAIGAMTSAAALTPHFAPMMLREIASGGAGLPAEVLLRAGALFQVFRSILERGRSEGVFRSIDPISTHMLIAGVVMLLAAGAPIRARLAGVGGELTAGDDIAGTAEALADTVYDLVIHGLRAAPHSSPDFHRTEKKK